MTARAIITIFLISLAGAGFASPYDDAMRSVRTLSDSRCVRLLKFGRSHSDRSIPAFVISDFTVDSRDKSRILICAGQHGDEFDPVKSVLFLCKNLAAGKDPGLLKRCAIVVVPMVNPDGIAASRRENAVDVDTNRDWVDLTTCETRFVHKIIKVWKPNLLIDVHNWNEPSPTPGNALEVPACDTIARENVVLAAARRARDSSEMSLIECTPISDKRLFHRRYCALGYAAYLLETRNGEDYQARDRIYRTAIKSLVNSVSSRNGARYIMSPASMSFKSASVGPYLDPIPKATSNSTSLLAAVMLGIAFIITAFLSKPLPKRETVAWSHRFTRCAVDPEIGSGRIAYRHTPHPITARSWVNRRLRSRYVVHEPEPEETEDDEISVLMPEAVNSLSR